MNRKPLYSALVLTLLLLILHLYALHSYIYWQYRWFDIPMHILGGVAIGSFLLSFFSLRQVAWYFGCMLGIVVAWEVFEYTFHISTGQPDYWEDTIKDIFDGMLGSVAAYFIIKRLAWHSN